MTGEGWRASHAVCNRSHRHGFRRLWDTEQQSRQRDGEAAIAVGEADAIAIISALGRNTARRNILTEEDFPRQGRRSSQYCLGVATVFHRMAQKILVSMRTEPIGKTKAATKSRAIKNGDKLYNTVPAADAERIKYGAVEKTRTSTGVTPQRPQRCASTNSATTASPFGSGGGLAEAFRDVKREVAPHSGNPPLWPAVDSPPSPRY